MLAAASLCEHPVDCSLFTLAVSHVEGAVLEWMVARLRDELYAFRDQKSVYEDRQKNGWRPRCLL
jgi:hypothetical protein